MILNLMHRPELGEKREIYKLQQEYAHKLNLKVTLLISAEVLENDDLVQEIKNYHLQFGDEMALWLYSFKKKELGGNAPFWLISKKNKRNGLKYAVDLFREKIGKEPTSIGCYVLDSTSMTLIREISPHTKTVIASCFEEGTKVFHGCNNSWYLFSEGTSWTPWYPAKGHSFRPAADKNEWVGLVAIPHLSRDLALAFEGRNDFFSSHPANIQRGFVNNGAQHNYDFNLIDQYRMQECFNDGYSYYNVHVSAGWLGNSPNVQDLPEVSRKIYFETLEYLSQLKKEGKVQDMYMSEFGKWYEENISIDRAMVGLGKEMLFGSGKHYFWYCDSNMRLLIDANQGGSIGDIRPYAGQFDADCGADTKLRDMASYPYVIQSQFRTGTISHSADGSRTTCFVIYGNEVKDMCLYQTKVDKINKVDGKHIVELTPVTITFDDGLSVDIKTTYEIFKDGKIQINRKILSITDENKEIYIQEYFKGCYGFTEYPEDMNGILLEIESDKKEFIEYKYDAREIKLDRANRLSASIDKINTKIVLEAKNQKAFSGEIIEGHLFNPFYTLKLIYKLDISTKEATSCLEIQKLK